MSKADHFLRTFAYVGTYSTSAASGEHPQRDRLGPTGGIYVFDATDDGAWAAVDHEPKPQEAGYLVYSSVRQRLFAVDERKTDGRGPVGPPAAVHAFEVDSTSGGLTQLDTRSALGAFPTYLCLDEPRERLYCVSHGSFDHIQRVVSDGPGEWRTEYLYDDSTLVTYDLAGGRLGKVLDVQVFSGHGRDPNSSPQAGGHGQANAHAHCAVLAPSGTHLVVCDKATDRIYVYDVGSPAGDPSGALTLRHAVQLEQETGARHAAFSPDGSCLYVTLEFSSELAAFTFDSRTGELILTDRCSTVADAYSEGNEPAEVRVHPEGGHVYVNNRGEDSLAWFTASADGGIHRAGDVPLAKSIHPGLAARTFDFHPNGRILALADRPANLVRLYDVDAESGALSPVAEVPVPSPAYITFAELGGSER